MYKIENIRGLPLTPEVAQFLVSKLFKQQSLWRRSELVSAVTALHAKHGGIFSKSGLIPIIKKALQRLQRLGEISNASSGYWRAIGNDVNNNNNNNNATQDDNEILDNTVNLNWKQIIRDDQICDRIIGIGNESVYVYFFQTDFELAKLKQQKTYACKVGRTAYDVYSRIREQIGAAFAFPPIVGLIIKTTNSYMLEQLLHAALNLCSVNIQNTAGTEWFLTNPDLVEQLYNTLISAIEEYKRQA